MAPAISVSIVIQRIDNQAPNCSSGTRKARNLPGVRELVEDLSWEHAREDSDHDLPPPFICWLKVRNRGIRNWTLPLCHRVSCFAIDCKLLLIFASMGTNAGGSWSARMQTSSIFRVQLRQTESRSRIHKILSRERYKHYISRVSFCNVYVLFESGIKTGNIIDAFNHLSEDWRTIGAKEPPHRSHHPHPSIVLTVRLYPT